VTGFAELGERLIIGLNGYGIAATGRSDPVGSGFTLFHDRDIFAGRALSNLFVREGKLYCHVYRNTTFDTPAPKGTGIALLHIDFEDPSRWAIPESFRFQQDHPDWEAVEILPSENGAWKATWKKTGDTVEYMHVSFAYPGGPEQAVDRDHVEESYRFNDIRDAPEHLQNVYRAMARRSARDIVFHIALHEPGGAEPQRYRAGSANALSAGRATLRNIEAYRSGDMTVLLDPPWRIRYSSSTDQEGSILLPALPDGMSYSALWYGEDTCVVSFEYRDFFDIGASGILIVDMKP
jgi:hypothetical protein